METEIEKIAGGDERKCDVKKRKRGEWFTIYTVVKADSDGGENEPDTAENVYKTEKGGMMLIANGIINSLSYSATQYEETRTVTQKEIEQVLTDMVDNTDRTAFTVWFSKIAKPNEVVEKINAAQNEWENATKRRKTAIAKDILEGEKTNKVCIMNGPMKAGYFQVISLNDITENNAGIRLINVRTIEKLILKGVRYVLK